MLSYLRPPMPKRSNIVQQNPLVFEEGRSTLHFHGPDEHYSMTHRFPGSSIPTFFQPPLHFHVEQAEDFIVTEGIARFFCNDKEIVIAATDEDPTITVPPGAFHRFVNESKDIPLELKVSLYEPKDYESDERFFRNFFGYVQDCTNAQKSPSVFQLMRFLHGVGAPLAIPIPFAPASVRRGISRAVCALMGVVIGEWVLGYKGSYPEYYDPKASETKKAL